MPGFTGMKSEFAKYDWEHPEPKPTKPATYEVMGPTHEMLQSEQRQEGEPRPHGVPAGLGPPRIMLIEGAPHTLPVSQEIPHGPPGAATRRSRSR
jgi:hypothetical protein